jgi:hypothetical protein
MGRHLSAAYLAFAIFIFLVLATVSGRWTRDKDPSTSWNEIGIWSTCQCTDLKDGACDKRKSYLRSVEAFSLIAVGLEFLASGIAISEWFVAPGSRFLWLVITIFYVGAVIANIITWTTYAGYYKKSSLCTSGEQSWSSQGWQLSWAFGIRLIELGFVVLMVIFSVMSLAKGSAERTTFNKLVIATGLFLLLLTIITTGGRGWMRQRGGAPVHEAYEQGLWDGCLCRQNYYQDCQLAKRRMRGIEVFSVVSIVVEFVLVVRLLAGSPTRTALNINRALTALGFAAILISMSVFAEYATTVMCGSPAATDTQRFHWAFGIEVVAFICQTLLFVLLMATPVVEEPKKVVTEPAVPATTTQ